MLWRVFSRLILISPSLRSLVSAHSLHNVVVAPSTHRFVSYCNRAVVLGVFLILWSFADAHAQSRFVEGETGTAGRTTTPPPIADETDDHSRGGSDSLPRIGIVLSGGGARGFSQIGVLKVLEEMGVPIYAVVGTSIGGLLGGLYSSGYSAAELDSIVRSTDWAELVGFGDDAQRSDLFIDQKIENDRSLLTLRLDGFSPLLPEAVSDGTRMTPFIEKLVWGSLYHVDGSFDNLRYRFRAVATDLVSGQVVVLDSGNLALAMRASATIPLRFAPVAVDSMLLVDGGLLANIPVAVARAMGCDIVIAINTTSELQPRENLQSPWNVADQVVTLMMRQLSQAELSTADLVITPNLSGFSGEDFSHSSEIIDSGETEARRMLDGLSSRLKHHPDARRSHRNIDVVSYNPNGFDSGIIDSVAVHGYRHIPLRNLNAELIRLVGHPLNSDSVRASADILLRSLRRQGFSFFRIDSIRFDEHDGRLDVFIDEGNIRVIRYVGLHNCAEFVVSRELEFTEGDLFKAEVASGAVTRILNTGFFKQASIEPHSMNGGGLEVVVRVQERTTALLRLSANVTSERYTRLGIEVAQENLFGQGTRIGVRFGGGLRDRLGLIDLRTNRIYGTYWSFRMLGYGSLRNVNLYDRRVDQREGTIERNILGEYREERIGGTVRLGRQVERLGMVSIEGRYERQGARNLTVSATDQGWHTVSSLKFGTRFDTQDRVPYTRSGTVIDMSYETAQHLLGADESFSKVNVAIDFFASLHERHLLHPQIRLGLSDATLPLLEQFSLGGQYSMYGLREDESRGRQLLLASLEYRYLLPFRIYFDTYISLRYDIGATWLKPSEIRIAELEHGIGFSVGLDTPLGPADVALGRSFTFNKPQAPSLMNFGPVVAYFSFGFPFN